MKKSLLITSLLLTQITLASEVNVIQPPVELGESWTAQDQSNAELVMLMMREKLIQDTGNNAHMKRDAHPKSHGCVKAKLEINNEKLSDQQRVGLFAQNGSYDSIIRFSNGSPDHTANDTKPDVRGMAVKVLGVPYHNHLSLSGTESTKGTHDFLTMNSPVFFIKDSSMYVDFLKAFSKGGMGMLWFSITNPRMTLILLKAFTEKVNNPLDPDYHSATPYKLGPDSMKFKFVSCKEVKDSRPANPASNFLAQNLAKSLKNKGSCFKMYVQPNRDPRKNPVENPMLNWDSEKSPFIRVGTLNISAQSGIHSAERLKFCEDLTMNPWRAHVQNRPLGAANRTRLEVYSKQAQFRLDHNGLQSPNPVSIGEMP